MMAYRIFTFDIIKYEEINYFDFADVGFWGFGVWVGVWVRVRVCVLVGVRVRVRVRVGTSMMTSISNMGASSVTVEVSTKRGRQRRFFTTRPVSPTRSVPGE